MLRCDEPRERIMTTTARRPRKRWTYADYCRIPADRLIHEIIDGRHFSHPAPSIRHQRVRGWLMYELMNLLHASDRGTVLGCRIDLHLGPCTIVQPDVVVMLRRTRSIIGDKKLTGVPDLIAEVLSPEYREYDCRIKLERYQRAGVPEFWIVDADGELLEQYTSRHGVYGPPAVHRERVQLCGLRESVINLREVWSRASR